MQAQKRLKELTGKKNIVLTSCGNKAINLALEIAKKKGYDKIFFPDQGGWFYEKNAKRAGIKSEELKTNLGKINFSELKNCAVIFHTMPAYSFELNYDYEKLKEKNVFVIADICGTVGRKISKADIVVCSFGKHKVVNCFYGGCIASDEDLNVESDYEGNKKELIEKLENIEERINFLKNKRQEILKELKNYKVLRKEEDGINIILKEDISILCESKNWEFKRCPFKIRIMEKGTSIEIKRLNEKD